MSFIKKILNLFSAEGKDNVSKGDNQNSGIFGGMSTHERLTNKVILNELVEHFKTMIQEESFGERMVYPMSFNILLHSNDYPHRKEFLPLIPTEAAKEFHKIIAKEKERYNDATPIAKQWTFQFSSCSQDDISDGKGGTIIVREGHITTVAHLCSDVATEQIDMDTVVSIKLDNSSVFKGTDINMEAFKSINIINEGLYRIDFDHSILSKSPTGEQQQVQSSPINDVLAILSYSSSPAIVTKYSMKHNLIKISGNKENRKDASIMKLDVDNIENPHVQVRYIPESNKFQISVFALTKLNGKLLELSDGGQIKWYDLANNSKIFLNDTVNINFQINI